MKKTAPEYKTHILNGKLVLIRKLEPMERHYYHPNEYLYDGAGDFWLILKSMHIEITGT